MENTHAMFLYRHVSQVNVHVVKLLNTRVIFDGTETTETQLEEIRLERPKGCYEDVKTKVKFFASDQKRIVNVPKQNFV